MNFFTEKDLDSLVFFQVPKVLVLGEKYKSMKSNALKLYMVLFDRMKLSLTNNWKDEEGRYYVRMSQEGAAEIFGWSPTTFRSMKKELEKHGLLFQKQLGQGKTNLLYILKCEYDEKDVYVINKIVDTEMEENEKKAEKVDLEQKNNFCSSAENIKKDNSCSSRRTKVDFLEEQKLTTNNNNFIENEFNENEINIVNNLLPTKSEIIDTLVLEYMKQGLSKVVCFMVVNEVQANPDVNNFGGYLRTCLENALHKSKLKRGVAEVPDVTFESGRKFYNWLEERE